MINLYLVGIVFDDQPWEVVGVFSSKEKAESECLEWNYFVGPLVLDDANHIDESDWIGAYFPNLRAENDSV